MSASASKGGNSGGGFFDSLVNKVKAAVRSEGDDPYALFDEQCPASGNYPAASNVVTASDLRRLVGEISNDGAHSPPRFDVSAALDGIFAELAAAGVQLESVLQLERGTKARAAGLQECARLFNRDYAKDITAIDTLIKTNLRSEIVVPAPPKATTNQLRTSKRRRRSGQRSRCTASGRIMTSCLPKRWRRSPPRRKAGSRGSCRSTRPRRCTGSRARGGCTSRGRIA
jgi:hypothetical protein